MPDCCRFFLPREVGHWAASETHGFQSPCTMQGYWKPDVYEGMAKSGMRMAKATVGYDLFWELVYYQTFNVPFFWWIGR